MAATRCVKFGFHFLVFHFSEISSLTRDDLVAPASRLSRFEGAAVLIRRAPQVPPAGRRRHGKDECQIRIII